MYLRCVTNEVKERQFFIYIVCFEPGIIFNFTMGLARRLSGSQISLTLVKGILPSYRGMCKFGIIFEFFGFRFRKYWGLKTNKFSREFEYYGHSKKD